MPMIQFIPDTLILSSEVNQNFDNTVALDTSRTVLVPHTWNARQNLIGGILVGQGSAQQPSLALNLNGSVGPVGFYRKQGDLIGIAGRLDVPPGPQGPPGPPGTPGAPGIQVSDRFDNIIEAFPDDRNENLAENRDFNDGPIGSPQDPHFYVSASGVWTSSTAAQAWQPPRAAQYNNAAQSPTDTAILFINGQPPGAGLVPLEDFWGFRLVVRAKISGAGPVPAPFPFLHISWRNAGGTQIGSSTRALGELTAAYRRYALEAEAPPGTVFGAFSIRLPPNAQNFSFQFDGLDIRRMVGDGTAYAQYQWTDVRFFGVDTNPTTRAAAINEAIQYAADRTDGRRTVFIPESFIPYNPALVTFDPQIRMVREGQVSDVFDVIAYGAVREIDSDAAAVRNSAAFNAMFDHSRAMRLANNSPAAPAIHIPGGQYFVGDSIWAGYPVGTDADFKDISIEAHGAQLIPTANLADRVVFDMSNTRRAEVMGLEIRSTLSGDDAPRIGMLLCRPVDNASAGVGYFERVVIRGNYKVAASLQFSSETDFFQGCTFRNTRNSAGSYGLIIQGINTFDASSEFIENTTTQSTNIDHFFSGCRFESTYSGPDFTLGGPIRLINAQIVSFIQCYIQGAAGANGQVGLMCSNGILGLSLTDCHFHRTTWGSYIRVRQVANNVELRGNGRHLAAQGAIIMMEEGASINRVHVRHGFVGAGGEEGNRFMIDGRAPNCNVQAAYLYGPYRTAVSGTFDGKIEVPNGVARVNLTGPPGQAHARVVDTLTMEETLVNFSDYNVRVANGNTMLELGDRDGLVRRSGAGPANFTYTFPNPDPFIVGTRIDIVNAASAPGSAIIIEDQLGAHQRLLLMTATGFVVGPHTIPPGYSVKCIKVSDNWNIIPYSDFLP